MGIWETGIVASAKDRFSRHVGRSEFTRGVATLMAGAAAAQLIPILISPLLTRLYSPEEFGEYGFFMSLVSVVAALATLRYDTAIVLPRDEEEARRLLALSLSLAVGTGLLLALVVVADSGGGAAIGGRRLGAIAYLLPPGVFLIAACRVLGFWATRRKRFALVSRARIGQSAGAAALNLGAGFSGAGAWGLVSAVLFANLLGAALLARGFVEDLRNAARPGWARLWGTALNYRDFALKGAPALVVSTAAGQSLLFLSLKFHGAAFGGYLVLIERVVGIFSQVVGNSIGEVFYRKVAERDRGNYPVIRKVAAALAGVSILFHLTLGLGIQLFFVRFFGSEWSGAVPIALWFLAVSTFSFVFAPVSVLFSHFRIQGFDFLWQSAWLVSNVGVFWFGHRQGWDFVTVFRVFVAKQCLLYLLGLAGLLAYARSVEAGESAA